jgi:hypothetical protein
MAKITTRANLNVGTELTINTTALTFTLNVAGNMVAKDGVSIQTLYSKFVDLWETSSYQDYPFPMYAIDALSGQFQFGTDGSTFSGWVPANDATRQMLRDGGWAEYSNSGVLNRVYVGIISLGSVSSGAQLYYQTTSGGAASNFTFTDAVNQGIQVYGNATNGNFDTRTYFQGYVRQQGYLYQSSVLADTGKTATGAYIVDLLLSNSLDSNILANDAAMSASPYSGITINYYGSPQSRTIAGVARNFNAIIAGNGATIQQIYTKIQYLLRQSGNINSGTGTVVGRTAAALLSFAGSTLTTTLGVYIDNIQLADASNLVFTDNNGSQWTNSYTAQGIMSFNSFLIGSGSDYRMMFSSNFGTSSAVTVQDASGNPITGSISGGSIAFTFNYDGDTLGGTAGTDKAVTLVGINPGSGKYTVTVGTLTRSKAMVFSMVAEQDRVYA